MQPPRKLNANTEGRGKTISDKKATERFSELAKRLVNVPKEELRERERLYDLAHKPRQKDD